ncbi:MAG: class I SAM-dependent methyltransferase [Alphaproteobacteria bacterium]|nr:class I SAM-dependent methyltransferase [Alphaproteobacteria bacterium]
MRTIEEKEDGNFFLGLDRESYLRFRALSEKHHLSYHMEHLFEADHRIGLSGKRVLEVGGSLPAELVLGEFGATQWVGIQDISYWREVGQSQLDGVRVMEMSALSSVSDLDDHTVLLGNIEALPECLWGHFDLIYSSAAFEHILRFGQALSAMAAALKPGGGLFSMFSPIWSAFDGHHLPTLTDKAGRTFGFSDQSVIGPWAHLLRTPPEMFHFLRDHTDEETASQIVYYIYNSPHINRLFVEDYMAYLESSPFFGDVDATFSVSIDDHTLEQLLRTHPGRRVFHNDGLRMVLRKRP